jgi:uncharacterized FlgJ-related protein
MVLFIVSVSTIVAFYEGMQHEPEVTSKGIDVIAADTVQVSIADSVKAYIERLNIQHPDIVFAIARLESGNFTSTLFLENNNCFGMKRAAQRPTTASGVKGGYAKYDNWQMSVIDFALYQAAYCRGMSRENFTDYIGRNYSKTEDYVTRLTRLIYEK